MPRHFCSSAAKALSALAVSSACLLAAAPARAVGSEEPEAKGKGIVGGALVLSELTLTIEAAIGVKPWWGYVLGGGLGAIGGGIGGYFIADAAGPEVPTAMLISGVVLAIPTTIFVLSQTAYRPPQSEQTQIALATSRMMEAPLPRVPSLFERNAEGRFGLGIPAVNVSFSPPGSALGQAGHGLSVPLLDLQFR